jgi:copper/silver efflux system protein
MAREIATSFEVSMNIDAQPANGPLALAGVAAETRVAMLIYLDHALEDRRRRADAEKRVLTGNDLRAAIMKGTVERVRSKMVTVVAIMAGLLPILWSHGAGSEVIQRIAVPMIGGMVSSTVLTLVVIPAIYALVKGSSLSRPLVERQSIEEVAP